MILIKTGNRGISALEYVIGLVILTLLLGLGFYVYMDYIRRAMVAEGITLCKAVETQQNTYHYDHGYYRNISPWVYKDDALDLDFRQNRYFYTFRVYTSYDWQTYKVKTFGAKGATGIMVVYDTDPDNNGKIDSAPKVTISGI